MIYPGEAALIRILVVESNTPELCIAARERGHRTPADIYASALTFNDPGLAVERVAPYEKRVDLAAHDEIHGVAFTGSGVDWSTDDARAEPLRHCMEQVFERCLPTIGSCNGMQLAAVVLGGRVGSSPNGLETGVASLIRLDEGLAAHPLLAGRPERFCAPTIHRDEVQVLPDGAVHLVCNPHTAYQAFSYERDGVDFWGTQYHPEMRISDVAHCLGREAFDGADMRADALANAEHDDTAARQLGTSVVELSDPERTTELRNWLHHVHQCHDTRSVA